MVIWNWETMVASGNYIDGGKQYNCEWPRFSTYICDGHWQELLSDALHGSTITALEIRAGQHNLIVLVNFGHRLQES